MSFGHSHPRMHCPTSINFQVSGNSHLCRGRFSHGYSLDLPQSSTQTSGNGKFDVGGTNTEQAIVVFGLGKGGRSYYAINLADPSRSLHQWALCPDEPYNYPATRIKSGQSATPIANMGPLHQHSDRRAGDDSVSRQPANRIWSWMHLLGGGYSDTRIEVALPGSPAGAGLEHQAGPQRPRRRGELRETPFASGTPVARPGQVRVSTGVVPLQYAQGSGLDKRAHFTDIYCSLWALGSNAAQGTTGGYQNFILDSASVDSWVTRQVYSQAVAAGSAWEWADHHPAGSLQHPLFPGGAHHSADRYTRGHRRGICDGRSEQSPGRLFSHYSLEQTGPASSQRAVRSPGQSQQQPQGWFAPWGLRTWRMPAAPVRRSRRPAAPIS